LKNLSLDHIAEDEEDKIDQVHSTANNMGLMETSICSIKISDAKVLNKRIVVKDESSNKKYLNNVKNQMTVNQIIIDSPLNCKMSLSPTKLSPKLPHQTIKIVSKSTSNWRRGHKIIDTPFSISQTYSSNKNVLNIVNGMG
jgi:hypothetical protein